jgi:hypothetical protein
VSQWNQRAPKFPPDSASAWVRLAAWELGMGAVVCGVLALGVTLVVTSPDRILTVSNFDNCYGPSPITLPCERIIYTGGMMNVAFTGLFGLLLIAVAAWFLWELWSAVEPTPITDDFLKLLNESFGRNWRDPRTWPWARLLWAYGFTLVGATLTAGAGVMVWALISPPEAPRVPTVNVETSQIFRLGQ